jgi:hypothetical protein
MKTPVLFAIVIFLVLIGISVGLISYSYFNYAQMNVIRLDKTLLQAPMASANFVDISNNTTVTPKLQEGMNEVGTKYDNMLKTCNNNSSIQGYCEGLPINAIFTTTITADEFQMLDKVIQLKPLVTSVNNTWFSNLKYRHDGCFPPAHGFQFDSSGSDNYCYYNVLVEKR